MTKKSSSTKMKTTRTNNKTTTTKTTTTAATALHVHAHMPFKLSKIDTEVAVFVTADLHLDLVKGGEVPDSE